MAQVYKLENGELVKYALLQSGDASEAKVAELVSRLETIEENLENENYISDLVKQKIDEVLNMEIVIEEGE